MNILYLTFYFEPDLCPGSFRNTSLVHELASQLCSNDCIHVITTQPNRYRSYQPTAPDDEEQQNGGLIRIQRVAIPAHKSGLLDQVIAFGPYYRAAHQLTRYQHYDLIVASSSRLLTAFLGAKLARRHNARLFLDIRDLFREAIADRITWPVVRTGLKIGLRWIERYTFGYASHINLVSSGFASYFTPFTRATYSYFTNGIDPLFLNLTPESTPEKQSYKTILYAGNIGAGQALHTIIPQVASRLGDAYRFRVIGDGGAVATLKQAISAGQITTVDLSPPLSRRKLVEAYQQADYLLVHLTDWPACRRVLPSKLFEYGATHKPILAGVAGYAAAFVKEHLPNAFVFEPGDGNELIRLLTEVPYRQQERTVFKAQFQRQAINQQMALLIRRVADKADQPCRAANRLTR